MESNDTIALGGSDGSHAGPVFFSILSNIPQDAYYRYPSWLPIINGVRYEKFASLPPDVLEGKFSVVDKSYGIDDGTILYADIFYIPEEYRDSTFSHSGDYSCDEVARHYSTIGDYDFTIYNDPYPGSFSTLPTTPVATETHPNELILYWFPDLITYTQLSFPGDIICSKFKIALPLYYKNLRFQVNYRSGDPNNDPGLLEVEAYAEVLNSAGTAWSYFSSCTVSAETIINGDQIIKGFVDNNFEQNAVYRIVLTGRDWRGNIIEGRYEGAY